MQSVALFESCKVLSIERTQAEELHIVTFLLVRHGSRFLPLSQTTPCSHPEHLRAAAVGVPYVKAAILGGQLPEWPRVCRGAPGR